MELQQVIYHIFVTQIEFGTYRLGDRLPTIEEAGQLLFVSPDTVRSAYLRLKKEGYITLSNTSELPLPFNLMNRRSTITYCPILY